MDIRNGEISCPLRERALETPQSPAMSGSTWTIDYVELDNRVSAAVRRLRTAGCETGSRIALYSPADGRYVVLLLALLRLGAVACPLSTRLPPQAVSELARGTGISMLISDDDDLNGAISLDDMVDDFGSSAGVESGTTLVARGRLRMPLDRAATIIFTSGSSGRPRAALHTFGNHYYSALGSGANIALSGGDRWLLSLPLYHVGGLSILFRCLLAGATISVPETGARLEDSIPTLGVTHVSLVATQLRRLLDGRANLSGLKTILLGGGPVPAPLVDEAVSANLPVHTSYGLTEMASQVTTTPRGASSDRLKTAGRVLPNREVSVSGVGEVLVRGKTLFAGYVEDGGPERPTDETGWFHTGDLGELDPEGYLRVWGRKDNLFMSGGENIQPEEIEEALAKLKGVERAVVAPIPDEEFGERPVAFMLAVDDTGVPDGLAVALEEALPRFKIPIAFHDWPEGVDPGKAKVDRSFFKALATTIHGNG